MGIQVRALPAGKPSVTTVEVSVNGLAVANGSVISAVGPMTVTSATRTRVIVDGIEWTPVSREGNTDIYSLTVGGRITIFDDSSIVFTYLNDYAPDFTYARNRIRIYKNSELVEDIQVTGTYVQARIPADTTRIRLTNYPANVETAALLEPRCSQENASINLESDASTVVLTVTNYDPTQRMEIYLGNVLLAYLVA